MTMIEQNVERDRQWWERKSREFELASQEFNRIIKEFVRDDKSRCHAQVGRDQVDKG